MSGNFIGITKIQRTMARVHVLTAGFRSICLILPDMPKNLW